MIIFAFIILVLGYWILKFGNIKFDGGTLYWFLTLIMLAISFLILKLNLQPSYKYTLFGISIIVILHNLIIGIRLLFNK